MGSRQISPNPERTSALPNHTIECDVSSLLETLDISSFAWLNSGTNYFDCLTCTHVWTCLKLGEPRNAVFRWFRFSKSLGQGPGSISQQKLTNMFCGLPLVSREHTWLCLLLSLGTPSLVGFKRKPKGSPPVCEVKPKKTHHLGKGSLKQKDTLHIP